MIRPSVAAGMVFVLFLAGCGGGGGKREDSAGSRESGAAPPSPSQVLRTMVAKADALRSARGTVAKTSYASGRVTRMMGSVHYRFKPQLAITRDFATPATGFDQVEFLVGDTFYMTVPVGHAPAGRWVEYDVRDKNARTAGKVADLLATARQDDPAMNLRMFTASNDMRPVGTEAIWGVPTTHYRGTFSVPKALAELGPAERARARRIFAPVGAGEVSFDLWVDGRRLPHQIRVVTPPGDKVHWDMTTLYVGFDEQLSIKPPPAYLVTPGH